MEKLTHEQIAELVVKAQKGDQEAFAALYTATVDRQLYFATAFLGDPAIAEDVVQEVYLKMFRSINRLKDPRVFVSYINRICYNTCVDFKKKNQVHKYELNDELLMASEDVDANSKPENFFENKETNSSLFKAIGSLPEKQKTAFLLRYYQNLKIKDISTVMKVSESTVKRAVNDATTTLQQMLKDNI